MSEKIAVIGAGSWGTALSLSLCGGGHTVRIWDVDGEHLNELLQNRENKRYLPDVKLPETLKISFTVEEAIEGADISSFFQRRPSASEALWKGRCRT